MYSKHKQRFGFNCTVLFLGVCACCVSFHANAAGKTFAKPARTAAAKQNENPRLQPASSLGVMLGDDDCEEDYATQVMSRNQLINTSSNVASAPTAKQDLKENTSQIPSNNVASMDTIALAAQTKENRISSDAKSAQATKPATTSIKTDVPVTVVPMNRTWEIALSDKTLNGAIARWTSAAGWQLVWELPVDYAIEAKTTVPGTFEEAIETVVRSMETAEIPMKAIFYRGNKVLRIVQKGGK